MNPFGYHNKRHSLRENRHRYLRESVDTSIFTPEAKDIDRAKSANSEARVDSQIKSIKDLAKLARRFAAFQDNSAFGHDVNKWVDHARALGADQDYIDAMQNYGKSPMQQKSVSVQTPATTLDAEDFDDTVDTVEVFDSPEDAIASTEVEESPVEEAPAKDPNKQRCYYTEHTGNAKSALNKYFFEDGYHSLQGDLDGRIYTWDKKYNKESRLEKVFWEKCKSVKIAARHITCLKSPEAVLAGIRNFINEANHDLMIFNIVDAWFNQIKLFLHETTYSSSLRESPDKEARLRKNLEQLVEDPADTAKKEQIAAEEKARKEQEFDSQKESSDIGDFVKKLTDMGYDASSKLIDKRVNLRKSYYHCGRRGVKQHIWGRRYIITVNNHDITIERGDEGSIFNVANYDPPTSNGQRGRYSKEFCSKTDAWQLILKDVRQYVDLG